MRRERLAQQHAAAVADVPVRFEGLPGEYLQVDWCEVHRPCTRVQEATAMQRTHTRLARAGVVLAVLVVALAGNLSGPGRIAVATGRPPSAVPLDTAGPPAAQQTDLAADLAARLTGAAGLDEALAATQETLARGGIATADLDGMRVAAVAPAASLRVSTAETVRLALEAHGRATALRLTGAELGRMLAEAGWPVPTGSTPGEQALAFLRAWVLEARQRPTDPQAFAPLFLAELARRQSPPVDLTDATTRPEDLRLTLLELLLLGAAFNRLATPPASALAAPAGTPALQDGVQYRVTSQVDPCLDLRQWYGSQLGEGGTVIGEGANIGRSELTGAALERIVGEGFGNAMAALGIATRVWKLVSFYSDSQVTVLVDPTEPNPLHKKLTPYMVVFIARAGVSEEDFAAYQRALGDAQTAAHQQQVKACLNAAGLPTPSNLADLAAEAESWRVEWHMVRGGDHAYIEAVDSGLSGTLRQHLARTSATTAEALVGVTVKPEKESDHPGTERSVPVTMCADVIASQPPSASTFLNAAKGLLGLADALVELGIGWFQEMVTPRSCATLTVTYHEPYRRFRIEGSGTYTRTARRSDDAKDDRVTVQFQVDAAVVGAPESLPNWAALSEEGRARFRQAAASGALVLGSGMASFSSAYAHTHGDKSCSRSDSGSAMPVAVGALRDDGTLSVDLSFAGPRQSCFYATGESIQGGMPPRPLSFTIPARDGAAAEIQTSFTPAGLAPGESVQESWVGTVRLTVIATE